MRASHQGLWDVNDNYIDKPGLKFTKRFSRTTKDFSPLAEATVEQWGCFQFDNAPVPKEMEEFVTRFVQMLGITSSRFSSAKEVCHNAMLGIEYEEQYFYLVDTLVQISHNELGNTYRHKLTGDILNPDYVETFKIERGWDFLPFKTVKNMIEHPGMQAFLNNNIFPPQFKDRDDAMGQLLVNISDVVWGKFLFGKLELFVDQMLSNHQENLSYGENSVHDERSMYEARESIERDYLFWLAGTIGVMTWFKGPGAIPFLAEYHVIYEHLLEETEQGLIIPISGTGGEVVVDRANVYTHLNLEMIPGRDPDTCMCCNTKQHCTKYVNFTALEHPKCYCGQNVDPLKSEEEHGYSRECQNYRTYHPARYGFVCQRCIFKTVNHLPQDIKCGRGACPAIHCVHHMGEAARLRALTQARTHQLTASVSH